MSLVSKVNNFFKKLVTGEVADELTDTLLGTDEAELDKETKEIMKNIEIKIEKDFEYYSDKYHNSFKDTEFRKNLFKDHIKDIAKFYLGPVLVGGVVLDQAISDDPKVTVFYLAACGLLGVISGVSKYIKFRKSLKIAKQYLKWLKDYINMNRDELIETEGRNIEEIFEYVENVLEGNDTEQYEQLKEIDENIKTYKKSRTTKFYKKYEDDQETIITLRDDVKYLKEKIEQREEIGRETDVRLKAIEDNLKKEDDSKYQE